jgi:hypothetical protein
MACPAQQFQNIRREAAKPAILPQLASQTTIHDFQPIRRIHFSHLAGRLPIGTTQVAINRLCDSRSGSAQVSNQ